MEISQEHTAHGFGGLLEGKIIDGDTFKESISDDRERLTVSKG